MNTLNNYEIDNTLICCPLVKTSPANITLIAKIMINTNAGLFGSKEANVAFLFGRSDEVPQVHQLVMDLQRNSGVTVNPVFAPSIQGDYALVSLTEYFTVHFHVL